MSCAENYLKIKKELEETGSDCLLIAVSKTKPVSMIQEVYDAGCRDFGENKVQEICSKYTELPSDIRWHLIGHLQTNKVKQIIDKVYLIHSVDSIHLAQEISKEAVKKGIVVSILLEVNVACEESKYGLRAEEVMNTVSEIAVLPGIHIRGLMTIAPYTVNPEENRPYFAVLRQLAVDINSQNIDNVDMDILSMGMSIDYKQAVSEGSSMIRVGTDIFGERIYNIV